MTTEKTLPEGAADLLADWSYFARTGRNQPSITATEEAAVSLRTVSPPQVWDLQKKFLSWWDSLPIGTHSPDAVEAWIKRARPIVNAARAMPLNKSSDADVREAAMAICAETCAFMGEMPCYAHNDDQGQPLPWPAPACDEPGCMALAKAALAALPLQDHVTPPGLGKPDPNMPAGGWSEADKHPADEVRRLVDEQARDEGLWFQAQTCAEAYVQTALRKLHAAVEGDKSVIFPARAMVAEQETE